MPEASILEFPLVPFAGRAGAAAIYGDLKEIGANRGRIWFFIAYVRTFAVLSWRVVAAVIAGMMMRQVLVNTLSAFFMRHTAPWRNFHGPLIYWLNPSTLWFLLPFAAILYGVRDRFVRLTAMAALGTTVASLFMPPVSLACAVVTLVLAASILFLIGWWKQATVLVATVSFAIASGLAAGNLSTVLLSHGYIARYGHGITGLEPMLAFRGSMLLSAYLCARLHGWLLAPGDRMPA